LNEVMTDMVKDGLVGLRKLLAGKHLRPAELALTLVAVHWAPAQAEEILTNTGAQARWETVDNG